MNTTTFTMHCGAGPHCRHHICAQCGKPLRKGGTFSADHPGTSQQYTAKDCKSCWIISPPLTPHDLQDQRHILLSDEEMAHIYEVDPLHHDWIMRRRYRLRLGEAA